MSRPHIFLLTVDCLRADRLGCYGYEPDTTPSIDELASNGIRWERCYSTGPRTNESFPGIVAAGLSADCGYAGDVWHRVPPSPTIASWLSSEGYHTAARLANPQLATTKRYDEGFDSFENLRVGNDGLDVSKSNSDIENSGESKVSGFFSELKSKVHDLRQNLRDSSPVTRWTWYIPLFCAYREYQRKTGWPIVDGHAVRRELINSVDTASGIGSPLFRWGHFNDIHAPIHPDRVNDAELTAITKLKQYLGDIERIRQVDSETYERMYDSMVRYVDTQVGQVVSELKTRGLWDDSIVIVTADHGESLFDRGVHGHASGQDRYLYDDTRDYMYNELLNVPLVVGGGAVEFSDSISSPFSTAWINELVAQLADIPAGEFTRSSDLQDLLGENDSSVVLSDALTDKGHTFSAISGDYKLVTRSLSPGDDVTAGAHLFDLHSDPEERSPLDPSETPQELVESIRDIQRIEDLPDTSRTGRVSDQTKELLTQLGYAE